MSACPECNYFASKVNETRRLQNGWVKRHRRCLMGGCGHRFYTFEMPAERVDVSDQNPGHMKEIETQGGEQ